MDVKVGDRVRAVKGTCVLNVGQEYTVDQVDSELVWVYRGKEYGLGGYPHDYFEPVAVAGSNGNRFKVGDRVRRSFAHAEGTILAIEKQFGVYFAEIDYGPWGTRKFGLNELEFAPLTIQSGKFYRTRDGRKVGPMRKEEESRYWWTPDDVFLWHPDGRVFLTTEHPDDFIAEWTDEPVAAGDSSDNTTDDWYFGKTVGYIVPLCAMQDDASKFKVGDRVKFRDDYDAHVAGTEATVVNVDDWGIMVDGVDGKSTESPSDLRLVAPVTSGNDNESDANLRVSISLDTSALDAEIDRVKKRLKKLAKRARKMGIALEYSELRDAA